MQRSSRFRGRDSDLNDKSGSTEAYEAHGSMLQTLLCENLPLSAYEPFAKTRIGRCVALHCLHALYIGDFKGTILGAVTGALYTYARMTAKKRSRSLQKINTKDKTDLLRPGTGHLFSAQTWMENF